MILLIIFAALAAIITVIIMLDRRRKRAEQRTETFDDQIMFAQRAVDDSDFVMIDLSSK